MDIVGDIHGEFEALQHLLQVLGYDARGRHPEKRKLVFTGDLVDRGPNSPAVMDLVIDLVESGLAYCVLGNHELNILRGVRKGGNNWILAPDDIDALHGQVPATPEQARRYLEFLNQQPFALAGEEVRVVHACWDTASINKLESMSRDKPHIGDLYREVEGGIVSRLADQPVAQRKQHEVDVIGEKISDPLWSAKLLPGHADVDMALQMDNSLRVLTTGPEQIAEQPFWAGGKWRMTERAKWWEHYNESVPVVIGHFWRLFDDNARRITGMFGADVFEGIASHAWMGQARNVYCIDYSVGQRHLERQRNDDEEFHGKLAALRYPEWEVVHDSHWKVAIGSPGASGR
jgi:hypothetical protein